MPTIFKPEKTILKRSKHSIKKDNLIHKLIYNTDRWRTLRINKLMNEPLCECEDCKKYSRVKLAIDVHHILPISNGGENVQSILALGYTYANLLSVARECHKEIHRKLNEDVEYLY